TNGRGVAADWCTTHRWQLVIPIFRRKGRSSFSIPLPGRKSLNDPPPSGSVTRISSGCCRGRADSLLKLRCAVEHASWSPAQSNREGRREAVLQVVRPSV